MCYHIWPKTELFLVGQMLEILSAPSYPLREEAGLVSPRFFFLREFFSRVLLSERKEQAILKVIKKN